MIMNLDRPDTLAEKLKQTGKAAKELMAAQSVASGAVIGGPRLGGNSPTPAGPSPAVEPQVPQ